MRWQFLLITLLGITVISMAAVPADAGDPSITITEDNYEYHDGFWWKGDFAFSREKVSTPGGWAYNSYGQLYQLPGSYHYSYTSVPAVVRTKIVNKTVTSYPAVPAYTPDWKIELLKYADQLDDRDLYEKMVSRLAAQRNSGRLDYSNSAYSNSNTYGNTAIPFGGNTIYGYSFQQIQSAYGELNVNAALLQAARGRDQAQSSATQAQTELGALVDKALTGQGLNARIIAEALAAKIKLDAARPTPSVDTTTSGQGSVITPSPALPINPMTLPAPDPDQAAIADAKAFLVSTAIPLCAKCHSGNTLKGKFDILSWPTLPADTKEKYLAERIYGTDKDKLMPRNDDNSPGQPLSAAQKKAFATH